MGDFVKIGGDLKAARSARGISLAQVSAELCINTPYLEAIENGELEALPGRTYVIGFVRAYAEFLELDASAIIDDLRSVHEKSGPAPCHVHIPEPVHESRIPAIGVLIAAGLGILFMALTWTGAGESLKADILGTPQVPDHLSALLSSGEAEESPHTMILPPEILPPEILQGRLELHIAKPTHIQFRAFADDPVQEQILM